MEAVAHSGMELTLVPPWIVPRFSVVRGSSGSGVWASAASAEARAAMGLGVPASVKLWPPGPLMVTWKRRLPRAWVTAESAPAPSRTMWAAMRPAVAPDHRNGARRAGRLRLLRPRCRERSEGRGSPTLAWISAWAMASMPCHAGAVVAGAGSAEAAVSVDVAYGGVKRSSGGEDGVEVRGEHDDGPAALRRQFGAGRKPRTLPMSQSARC